MGIKRSEIVHRANPLINIAINNVSEFMRA